MKRRFLTLGLAAVLTLSIFSGNSMVYAAETSLVEFENVILADDENVTLELVNFYSEDVNWQSGPQNEKYITVKATNKTDHDILLNPGKFYLNNEECYVSMIHGSITPEAGRAGTYSFCVAYNTTPEHTALGSLDELYTLEGSFSGLHVYEDSSQNASLEVSFAMPADLAAKAGGAEATAAASDAETEAAVSETSASGFPVDLEIWASYNDNQKNLYYAMEEIDEEVTGVFEYLGNMYMADGSRMVVDLLFIEAPEAEDGVYVYDIETGELYDHINGKKVAEQFEDREQCINTLANCYSNYAETGEWMWMDSEIIIRMPEEDVQEVLAVLG